MTMENKLNITNQVELAKAEEKISKQNKGVIACFHYILSSLSHLLPEHFLVFSFETARF